MVRAKSNNLRVFAFIKNRLENLTIQTLKKKKMLPTDLFSGLSHLIRLSDLKFMLVVYPMNLNVGRKVNLCFLGMFQHINEGISFIYNNLIFYAFSKFRGCSC